jgi:glycosyltransferase involved in cell wall biosynthesis
MRFSVIVPAYGEETLIERSLLSIKKQTFKDYELIVVIRPAGDRTEELASKYADKLIIQNGRGLGAARNLGASSAKGEILIFIDADTVITPSFMETLDKIFEDNNVISVVPKFYVYDGSGRGAFSQTFLSILSRIINQFKFLLYGMTAVIRKDAFQDLGGFRNVFGEDIDLALRMGERYKFNRKIMRYIPNLVAYTSSRRIKKLGILRGAHLWSYNLMRYWVLEKSFVGYFR